MYHDGRGVPQDYKKTFEWFTKAAEQGNALAQLALGFMYHDGIGLPQDYVQAYKWFNLAAAQDNEDAKKSRDGLLKAMTPAQIAEGQRLSREAMEKIQKK
jgi:hypothetical protein